MIAPHVSSFKQLQSENLRELAGCSGFCLSVFLPPFRPGETTRYSPAAMLKDHIREAESRLAELGATKEQIAALVEPLGRLAADPSIAEGFHWTRAILRSPKILQEFLMHIPASGMHAGGHFDLLPFVAEAELPHEIYLLKLSSKHVALARGGARLEAVKVPRMVETLEEFLELNQPDHDLENRSAVGGAAGPARRVRFGTGTERETHQTYLADYYRHVDHQLAAFVRPRRATVLLVGVEEDTSLFRSISSLAELADKTIQRSPDDGSTDVVLLQEAFALLRGSILERNRLALAEAKERLAPARYSEDVPQIIQMAAQGRVGQLYIAENASDDQLNRALIETLTHGGETHALPAGSVAGAALRY